MNILPMNERAGSAATRLPAFGLRPDDAGPVESSVGVQLDRIRRYRWLVLAIAVLCTVGGAVAAAGSRPTYTGQSTLSAANPAMAADGDAALAQGYVDFFNEGAEQSRLSERAGITDPGVTYAARTAGLGPVFYLTATTESADTARQASAAMTRVFADEINAQLRVSREQVITSLNDDAERTLGERGDPAALAARNALQQQINQINADRANQVTILQQEGSVSESPTQRIQTVGTALVGGLLLGCVVAIIAAIGSKRLETDYDVALKLGIEPLDVLPSASDARQAGTRGVRLQRLGNMIARAEDGRHPLTIAVCPAAEGGGAHDVAEGIANQRAAQGVPTILVHADLHRVDGAGPGLAELLDPDCPLEVDDVIQHRSDNLDVLVTGCPVGEPYCLFDRRRFRALLDELGMRASLIVVSAPSLSRAGEAQLMSEISDRALVVIDGGTKLEDAREALRVVDQVGATLFGVLLVEQSGRVPARKAEAAQHA